MSSIYQSNEDALLHCCRVKVVKQNNIQWPLFPDSLGLACDFTPHSYVLPQYNNGIASFSNYDLGTLDGSPCDTIVNITIGYHPPQQNFFTIYPNPVSDWINIIFDTQEDCLLNLYDINGKQVASVSLFHYFKNRLLNVSELPPGVYLAVVSCKGERVWSEKVMVQR